MRIKSKTIEPEAQEEAQAIVTEDGAMEFSGTMFLAPGMYKEPSEMKTALGTVVPESLQTLLTQLDPKALPLTVDQQAFLEQAQAEALQRVVAKGVDATNPQVQKLSSLAQLTPEHRKLLGAFLGEETQRKAAAEYEEPETKTFRGDTPQALFSHVAQKMAQTNAPDLHNEEAKVEITQPKPVVTTEAVHSSVKTTKPKEEVAPVNTLTRCPHCQLSLFAEPMVITEEDRNSFILAIISGQPYMEERRFFGGNVIATFRSLYLAESDGVEDAIDKISADSEISTKDKVAFYMRSYLACSLVKLKIGDKVYNYAKLPVDDNVDDTIDQILRRCEQLTKDIPNGDLFGLITNDNIKFSYKCKKLTAMGLNSDFWTPIQTQ